MLLASACVCMSVPLLLIQVPLSCCPKLILSTYFRTVMVRRDLAVGCVHLPSRATPLLQLSINETAAHIFPSVPSFAKLLPQY